MAAFCHSINVQIVQSIRLTKKLAPVINGVDLSKVEVGEVVNVPNAVAEMLIREGWAVVVNNNGDGTKN